MSRIPYRMGSDVPQQKGMETPVGQFGHDIAYVPNAHSGTNQTTTDIYSVGYSECFIQLVGRTA